MLSKDQVRFLKKEANSLKSIFQLGKYGLSEAFVEQVDQALEKRELIKFNLLQNSPENVKEVAGEVAEQTNSQVIQVIGKVVVLYRPARNPKNRNISLKVKEVK